MREGWALVVFLVQCVPALARGCVHVNLWQLCRCVREHRLTFMGSTSGLPVTSGRTDLLGMLVPGPPWFHPWAWGRESGRHVGRRAYLKKEC